MDGRCAICSQQFDQDQHIPRLIPSCGLSYCEKCILEAQQDPACCFQCPIDNQFHSLAYQVDTLPINIALIKTLGDLKTISFKQFNTININTVSSKSLESNTPLVFSSSASSASGGEKCHYHNMIKEFRCREDNQYVCSHCVLFGNHQNHQIESINRGASRVNKEKMRHLFEQVIEKMGELDLNIKQFLEPPNSFVKNINNLKKELKYEVKRKFKSYHQIISQKEQQLERQIDEVIQKCHQQMEQVQSQLNVQYTTICCIKQQINSVRSQIDGNNQFMPPSALSEKKMEEILIRIVNTSDQLVRMNEEIVEKCHEIEREYKDKINIRQFVKIKDVRIGLVDEGDVEEYNLMENSNLLERSKSFAEKSRMQDRKQNLGSGTTYQLKSHKPSLFAQNKFHGQVDILPQSSYLQPPSSTLPLKIRQINTVNQFTLRSDEIDLTKSYISSPSPTKNLTRYNSAFIPSSQNASSLLFPKPSQSLMLNRSKIQSIKDQQQKRQTGKLQMRKKVTKILESIESQKGTTLELIGMEIKDYYINQIFNHIKKTNKKYGLIKLVKNQITDEGFNRILNQLKDYQYAHTLNLTSNCLTEECLDWIVDFGMYNKALKNMYLKNNQINHIRTKDKKQQIMETGINLYY